MKKNNCKSEFLLSKAEKALKSGNKKNLSTILEYIHDICLKDEKVCSRLMPKLMDLGHTPFSYYNYFIRYKPFSFDASYVFLKKALLSDNYNDFSQSLKEFLACKGKKDPYIFFWCSFSIGNFTEAFSVLEHYFSSCEDPIIDDVCFPLRNIRPEYYPILREKIKISLRHSEYGDMYSLYFDFKTDKAEIKDLLRFNPPDSKPWMNYFKGKLLMEALHFNQAFECFYAVRKAYPNLLEPKGYLAELSLLSNKNLDNLLVLLMDNKRDNLQRSALSWAASIMLFSGDSDNALNLLKKNNKDPLSFCWFGAGKAVKREYESALKFLDRAISYRQQDKEAMIWKAHCLLFLGKKKECYETAIKAMSIDGWKIWPYIYLVLSSGDRYISKLQDELEKFFKFTQHVRAPDCRVSGYLSDKKRIREFCIKMVSLPYGIRREDNFWLWFMLKKAHFFK